MSRAEDIAAALARVRARIAAAERAAGRPPGAARLVAVSKRMAVDDLRAALARDLDAPAALAAIDAWAGASLAIDGDDAEAPGLIARSADSLLGVAL